MSLAEAAREAGFETIDAGLTGVLKAGFTNAFEAGLVAAWQC